MALELNLTGIKLLAPHLTADNHQQWLERARGKTKREVELVVAELAPQADVAARIRKLPSRRAVVAATVRALELVASPPPRTSVEAANETVVAPPLTAATEAVNIPSAAPLLAATATVHMTVTAPLSAATAAVHMPITAPPPSARAEAVHMAITAPPPMHASSQLCRAAKQRIPPTGRSPTPKATRRRASIERDQPASPSLHITRCWLSETLGATLCGLRFRLDTTRSGASGQPP